jgi:uncharacterized protein (DUF169 family)
MADDTQLEARKDDVTSGRQRYGQADVLRHRSGLQALGLEYPIVAVKFSETEPTDLPRLTKKIALCEMLKEVQEAGAFYASQAENGCKAGSYVLGQIGHDAVMESGRIGPAIGVYENAAANRRIYEEMIRFPEGASRYTLFARLDELGFDPDLLIITAKPYQAEVIMRAHGYRTGAAWEARGTTVIGCAYLYAYPYLTGKMNILISGFHHGMRARQLFPEGLLFIAIPSALLPEVLENLTTMQDKGRIDLPQYHWGKEAHEIHMRKVSEAIAEQDDLVS